MDRKLDQEGSLFLIRMEMEGGRWTHPVNDDRAKEFNKKVKEAEDGVNNWVVNDVGQDGFNALVSFVYSVGVDAFKRSTLLKRLNQGKADIAANEFEKWIFSEGRKDPGLVSRRERERKLFLTPPQSHLPEHPDTSPQFVDSPHSEVPA